MKPTIYIVISLVVGLLGFLIGKSMGYSQRNTEQEARSHSELVAELRRNEIHAIKDFVEVSSTLRTVDEGGLFKVKKVDYLSGAISNHALATAVKDIHLEVSYLSATGATISTETVIIYNVIEPSSTKQFREKVKMPEKTERFTCSLVDVGVE